MICNKIESYNLNIEINILKVLLERFLLMNSRTRNIVYEFKLDKVYDYDSTTEEIFKSEIKGKIENNMNIGLFIYGHTGSGKTFTLFGDSNKKGIFDLICSELNFNFNIDVINLTHYGNYDLISENKIFIYTKEEGKIDLKVIQKKISQSKMN